MNDRSWRRKIINTKSSIKLFFIFFKSIISRTSFPVVHFDPLSSISKKTSISEKESSRYHHPTNLQAQLPPLKISKTNSVKKFRPLPNRKETAQLTHNWKIINKAWQWRALAKSHLSGNSLGDGEWENLISHRTEARKHKSEPVGDSPERNIPDRNDFGDKCSGSNATDWNNSCIK